MHRKCLLWKKVLSRYQNILRGHAPLNAVKKMHFVIGDNISTHYITENSRKLFHYPDIEYDFQIMEQWHWLTEFEWQHLAVCKLRVPREFLHNIFTGNVPFSHFGLKTPTQLSRASERNVFWLKYHYLSLKMKMLRCRRFTNEN